MTEKYVLDIISMNYPSYNQTSVNNSKFLDEISSVHSCIKTYRPREEATGGMGRDSFRLANHVRSSNGWGQSLCLKTNALGTRLICRPHQSRSYPDTISINMGSISSTYVKNSRSFELYEAFTAVYYTVYTVRYRSNFLHFPEIFHSASIYYY